MYGWTASLLMSEKTGPMTNRVRNSAMPVSTWFGGEVCRPSAFRVRPRTTMILVNDVHNSRTDGATDRTVIARISVIEELGEPSPTEMSTVPAPGTTGATGAVGVTGAVGAADAGPASTAKATLLSTPSSRTRPARRPDDVLTACAPSARAGTVRTCP